MRCWSDTRRFGRPLLGLLIIWPALILVSPVQAKDFSACLLELQARARADGVAEHIVAEVMPGLQQQKRVLELDRKQPEFIQTFGGYLTKRVTSLRVEKGRELYARHREFLDQLTREYGVPGRYLVAFWGLETNFGSYMGSMPTLDSLATMACDERRSEFFSTELVSALRLMEKHDLRAESMRGSWAGAVGHTQFMPSNYARYAVDGDGDGLINLWTSARDALASGANFLQDLGWEPELRWGREVRLPPDFAFEYAGLDTEEPLTRWVELGVRQADGAPLPPLALKASLLVPAGHRGPAFLVYQNFDVIMRWNRSESYAIAVGHLADRIAGAGGLRQSPPLEQSALTPVAITELQGYLEAAGYRVGAIDGIPGSATRRALRAFQMDAGMIADGYPDQVSLERLRNERAAP
jgi:membrane-bound lytic murein transglycosylase B